MNISTEEILRELGDIVRTDEDTLHGYSSDKWFASALPQAVALPSSAEEVCRVLRFASQFGVPVTPRGAGVGYVGGCVPVCGGIVLSTERMNRIIEISPEDGVAVVEPGVLTADLQSACSKLGWFYPPDPASRKESSIGGNIATNAGGPRCLKYGVTRSYVLGLQVALADGRLLTCGGRTHKNKQGFDLVGLFCGSEGLLGIITRATLRIIPAPQARGALRAAFSRFSDSAGTVQQILQTGHLPCALEIADAFTLDAARRHLGTDALPPDAKGHLIVEIDGHRDSVSHELTELRELISSHGGTQIVSATTEEEIESIWELRRGFSESLKATGLTKLNEDVVIPRSQLVNFVEFCTSLREESGIPVACFGHAGDGNIHTNIMIPRDEQGKERRAEAEGLLHRLFAWVLSHSGSITGEHGIGLAKAPWFPSSIGSVAMDTHHAIKHALDPTGILNPGKLNL